MRDGNEAKANLQEKLAQARGLLLQITDTETTTEPSKFRRRQARPSLRHCRIERHISSTCRNGKSVRHGQRATLVGLQRNFLCQHDVACDQMTFRHKAPTNTWIASAVELVDVHRGAAANPVSLSAVAADDLKIAFRVILRELLGR